MINMILQKLLPTTIHCSARRGVVRKDCFGGVLEFEVLKLTEIANQQSINVFATKPPGLKGSQSRSNLNKQFCGLMELVFATFA